MAPFPMLRSETVKKGTIIASTDIAYATVTALGEHGNLHMEDLNAESMVRPFTSTLQRLETISQKIKYMYTELDEVLDVPLVSGNVDDFLQHAQNSYNIDSLEVNVTNHYERIKIFSTNNSFFISSKLKLIEELGMLTIASYIPIDSSLVLSTPTMSTSFTIPSHQALAGSLTLISGTIEFPVVQRFLRAIQMMAHGNVYVVDSPITSTFTKYGVTVNKKKSSKEGSADSQIYNHAFFIYMHGTKNSYTYQSMIRVCNAFDAHLYTSVYSPESIKLRMEELVVQLNENAQATKAYLQFFLAETRELLALTRPTGNSLLEEWKLYVEREKVIYTTLNKFQASDTTLRISCWLLADEEDNIRKTLNNISGAAPGEVFLIVDSAFPKHSIPPTYLRSNDFLLTFQMAVDTYGVPRYKEINPGLFTIIPFPFLFAVMFGDLGHGFVLFVAAVLVFLSRGKGAMSGAFVMRFFLLVMGMFSMYTGTLYNEFFGVGINFFGSRWDMIGEPNPFNHEARYQQSQTMSFPYPFGVDPAWRGASNELTFLNSFKMKFSIVAGFVQMFMGIILNGSNAIYRKNMIDFFMVFIPQVLFFLGFVGYLVFLIIYKWITPLSFNKPSLINTFIGVFLMTPITDNDRLYNNQDVIQLIIVCIMLGSVPFLILGKPVLETIKNKRQHKLEQANMNSAHASKTNTPTIMSLVTSGDTDDNSKVAYSPSSSAHTPHSTPSPSNSPPLNSSSDHSMSHHPTAVKIPQPTPSPPKKARDDEHDDEEGHSFGELITHQFIESTEFLLGALSNTASYLRLWALSLAHAELTKIILDELFMMFMTLSDNLAIKSVLLFFGGLVFVGSTTVIIMLMDFIEAFLHAVRLQWVEFQNKFYAADGVAFDGFSFKNALVPPVGI